VLVAANASGALPLARDMPSQQPQKGRNGFRLFARAWFPANAPTRAGQVSDTPSQAELPALVDRGLDLVRDRLQASPDFSIYLSIQRQLAYLKEIIAASQVLTEEKRASLTLGVYAAREFETSDPDFADVLFKVSYLANRMSAQ
jgi:hypothetical protein